MLAVVAESAGLGGGRHQAQQSAKESDMAGDAPNLGHSLGPPNNVWPPNNEQPQPGIFPEGHVQAPAYKMSAGKTKTCKSQRGKKPINNKYH